MFTSVQQMSDDGLREVYREIAFDTDPEIREYAQAIWVEMETRGLNN